MNRPNQLYSHAAPLFVILLSFASATSVYAQAAPENHAGSSVHVEADLAVSSSAPTELRALEQALTRGDASEIMRFSAEHVDVALFGSDELYSRSQARYVLKAFFDEFRPIRLALNEISGSEHNWFAAGNYWYASGDSPLAVYLRLRRDDIGWELREVRIGRTSDR